MKILLAHSDKKLAARESLDLWRIIRPFRELAKHVAWQIDHVDYLVPDELIDANNKADTEKLVAHLETLKDYDIIWTSYFPDAILFDCMTFLGEKYGVKFVLDCDDDIYHIPKHNHIWKDGGAARIEQLQWMVSEAPYVVTSTDVLKAEFDEHRSGKTYVLPNYIDDDYSHPEFDNSDKVVIGYFGSITHKRDLFETGFFEALQKIVHKYKNVHVTTVGIPIDQYLPKARYSFHPGKPGQAWLKEVWPNINCDIAVAPLEDEQFNNCKSNIKWLESALIPAAVVASKVTPYQECIEHGKTGLLTENAPDAWYEALESLVTSKALRKKLAAQAKAEVTKGWHIQNNWQTLKKIVEDIHGRSKQTPN